MISPHCGAIKLVSLKDQRHLLVFRIAKLLHRHYGSAQMYRDKISIKQDWHCNPEPLRFYLT